MNSWTAWATWRFISSPIPVNRVATRHHNGRWHLQAHRRPAARLSRISAAAGELPDAFWLLRESLEQAHDNAAAINMMAVVYRRAGDERKAEAVYRYGIANVPDKVSLLRNYRILLTGQGRTEEADAIAAELDRLAEPNPFDWIHAAQQAHEEGHYGEALTLYRRAADIAPYLHESYFGMAKSHLGLGNRERAETELAKALEHAHRASTRSLYEAKLMVLQSAQPMAD